MFKVFFTRNRVMFFSCLLFSMLFSYETLACLGNSSTQIKLPYQISVPSEASFFEETVTVSRNNTVAGNHIITVQAAGGPRTSVYHNGECWIYTDGKCLNGRHHLVNRNKDKIGAIVLDKTKRTIRLNSKTDNKPYIHIAEIYEQGPVGLSRILAYRYIIRIEIYKNKSDQKPKVLYYKQCESQMFLITEDKTSNSKRTGTFLRIPNLWRSFWIRHE